MFGLGLNVKAIIAGVLALAVVTIIGLGYRHYTSLLSEVDVLRANAATLELAVETQKGTIEAQRQALAEWSASRAELLGRLDELRDVSSRAATETRKLNDLFAKHDIGTLAGQKPGLVERRINAGTTAALRLLECASGAGGADCTGDGGAPTGAAAAAGPAAD